MLHRQPKKVVVEGEDMACLLGSCSFIPRGKGVNRVTFVRALRNKWSDDWARAWFYMKVDSEESPCVGSGVTDFEAIMMPSYSDEAGGSGIKAFDMAIAHSGTRDWVEEFEALRIQPLRSGWGFERFVDSDCGFGGEVVKVPLGLVLSRQTSHTDEAFVLEVEDRARDLLGPFSYNEYQDVCAHFGMNWRLNRVFNFFNLKYSPRAVPAAPKPRKRRADTMGGVGGGDGRRPETALPGQPPKKIRVSRRAEKGRLPCQMGLGRPLCYRR